MSLLRRRRAALVHRRARTIIREMAIGGCPTHPLFLNIHPAETEREVRRPAGRPDLRAHEDVYLEITESVPLSHFRLCQSVLREVRGRGVYLVVDDLGAGYSNLKYIADLHPKVSEARSRSHHGARERHAHVQARVGDRRSLPRPRCAGGGRGHRDDRGARGRAGSRRAFRQGYLLAKPAFPPPPVTWPGAVTTTRKQTMKHKAGLRSPR